MPVTPGSFGVDLNGVTAVTVVPAPAAATTRSVLVLRVFNLDTAAVDLTLQVNISGTKKTFEKVLALAAGAVWRPIDRDHIKILPGTTYTLEVFMSGAPATTNPHAEAEFVDKA